MSQSVISVAEYRASPFGNNEEIRDRVAACFGRVKRSLTYTVPRGQVYKCCEVRDPRGMYNVFSELLAAGTDLHIQENKRDTHQAQEGVDAKVEMPTMGGGLRAAHQQHSSDHSGHDLDVQAGRNAAVRIMIEGGKDGCSCLSTPSELEVWVVMTKKGEQTQDASPTFDETMREPVQETPQHQGHGGRRKGHRRRQQSQFVQPRHFRF